MSLLVTPTQKQWDRTCTKTSHLTQAALVVPQINDVIEYTEPRMLSTLIVSGAKSPYDTVGNRTKSKIGRIPENKKIGSTGYRFRKMGRIQINSTVLNQVGTTQADGTFVLTLKDDYQTQGMICQFYSRTFQARVMSYTGSPGAYVYTFKGVDGPNNLFDWNTHVAPQAGEKTCFGFFSTFGEMSDRGYSRSHYPEEYIEHMTIQRKSTEISGNAMTEVVWYNFGQSGKGWWWAKQRQMRLQWMRENEFHKWVSRSSMVGPNGEYLQRSNLQDEKGNDIIIGNGIIPQIEGGNELFGSGSDGFATIADFTDMMRTLVKKSNMEDYGNHFYAITGTEGYGNAQTVLANYWQNSFGGRHVINGSSKVGGPDVTVGANFDTLNFEGNSLTFVQHPLFDDELAWSARGSDGGVLQSGMYVFLCMNKVEGRSNVEILTNGNDMVNRRMVEYMKNGMTGASEWDIESSTDGIEYHMLMQDMIVIYNTEACGIIHRSPIV